MRDVGIEFGLGGFSRDGVSGGCGGRMQIVMAENSQYRGLYRVGCHHLAGYLSSQGHDILYLAGPINLSNLRFFVTGNPSAHDVKYAFSTWFRGGTPEAPNLLSYAPMTWLPVWRRGIFSSSWVTRNTLKFTVPNLARFIKRKGFGSPDVLLVSQPFFAELLDSVSARVKVYRLTDDIDKFPHVPDSVRDVEEDAAARADAVVVTSRPLVDKVKRYAARNIHYVPNGVDYDHYQSPASRPAEYKGLSGAVVIYIGAIDSWFDVESLAYCARALPDATFVLIGAPRIDLGVAERLPNVWCLGHRDYADLPSYLQHADVGIIPFTVTPLINSVSPLKLYEYMACGLPVVSSRWREVESIESPAYLADDKDEFLIGMKSALAENGSNSSQYKDFAARNSWTNRGERLERLFVEILQDGVDSV